VIGRGVGFSVAHLAVEGRLDAALFGEQQSRVVVSLRRQDAPAAEALLASLGVPYAPIGVTGGDRLRLAGYLDLSIADLLDAYESGLPRALAG